MLFLGEVEIYDEHKTALDEALGFLDVFLEGNDFAAGNKLTIADCSLAATVSSIVVCLCFVSRILLDLLLICRLLVGIYHRMLMLQHGWPGVLWQYRAMLRQIKKGQMTMEKLYAASWHQDNCKVIYIYAMNFYIFVRNKRNIY